MSTEIETRGPGRPLAASREAVEQVALSLMLRDGYDAVNVDAIAAAAGISRTTFFRYFGSKAGVVWAPFDATLLWLKEYLASTELGDDPLEAVRVSILESTRSALYSSDVWLERFTLLDTHPSLRSEAYEHWQEWKLAVATHVARAARRRHDDAVPMAIAGACHGVFVSELRNGRNADDDREAFFERLDRSLATICRALEPVLR